MQPKDQLKTIVPYFLKCIKDKNYQEIIDINTLKWSNYLVMLSWEDLIYYNLLVWAAYQEIWELNKANTYFDNYLQLVKVETLENLLTQEWKEKFKSLDDYWKRFMLLFTELNNLGLWYISPK